MLAAILAIPALQAGATPSPIGRSASIAPYSVGTGNLAAQKQKRRFFQQAPWEEGKKYIGRIPLDLLEDKSAAATVRVCIMQDPELCASADDVQDYVLNVPIQTRNQWDGWQMVGVVSAPSEADLPLAIAAQRQLIFDWAVAMGRKQSRSSDVPLSRNKPYLIAWTRGATLGTFDRPSLPAAAATAALAAATVACSPLFPTASGYPAAPVAVLGIGAALSAVAAAGWKGWQFAICPAWQGYMHVVPDDLPVREEEVPECGFLGVQGILVKDPVLGIPNYVQVEL